MTAHDNRLTIRAPIRSAGLVVAIATGVLAVLAVGLRTVGTFTGGGADMAHHYALAYWFSDHWTLPQGQVALDSMMRYPPGAHILAGLIGRVVDSPFRGMQLTAIAAVVLIWAAIAALLTTLPGRRRWVALGALATVLALNTSAGPLRLQTHGFEIIGNFFFSQALGQAVVWWLVWFAVKRRIAGRSSLSTALPIAIVAVLSTGIHVLPAVESLVLVGCLSADELVRRWRTGRHAPRSLLAPVLLPLATAVAIVLTPGFRAMRTLSENDGSLDVPYLSGLAGYVAVAVAVLVASLIMLLTPAARRLDRATASVLEGLGFAGIAIAVPCLAQAVMLAAGEGSPYAVKKYIFGLLTFLVVYACVVAAVVLTRGTVQDSRISTSWRFTATVALTVVAILAVFSRPGSGYSIANITTLERQVVTTVATRQLATDGDDYAVALPRSDVVLDYMFSIAVLGAPLNKAVAELLVPLLRGEPLQLQDPSGELVTAANSPYDTSACRRAGRHDGLVVVEAACWSRVATSCGAVNVVGQRGPEVDPRLRGFSVAEPTGRWTDGRRASFSCELAAARAGRPITLALDATGFLPPGVPRQRVTLAVGDSQATFVLTPRRPQAVLRLVVPAPSAGRLTLTLALPDAVSPQAAGLSADARELALFVSEIRID